MYRLYLSLFWFSSRCFILLSSHTSSNRQTCENITIPKGLQRSKAKEPCRTRKGLKNQSSYRLSFFVKPLPFIFKNHYHFFPLETPAMQNPRRSYLSLISRITKLTTAVIILDVLAMIACAALIPPKWVREPLILTAVAFVILIAFFFYSLSWDAVFISAYFEQLQIAREKATVAGEVVEGSENSSEQTVASRVVGITGVRLLDEELLWMIQPVEAWARQDDIVLAPDPVVLRVRK